MRLIKTFLAMCALLGGIGGASSALAADNPAPADRTLKGDAVCTRCHDSTELTPILAIYQTNHGVKGDPRTPGCQTCHGASEAHVTNPKGTETRPAPDVIFGAKQAANYPYPPSATTVQTETCLSCHKGGQRTHWDGSQHQVEGLVCASCHTIHAADDKVRDRKTQREVCFACHKEQRAQTKLISTHPIDAGKVVCSDCHNPHGSAGPKLLKKNTVNETCWQCHAEKRGPFLWEHQPVTEDCTNCHTPHGSNITPLLKSRVPFLCEECHDGPHQSASPIAGNVAGIQGGLTGAAGKAASPGYGGRSCMNCHPMVHGSNSPAGSLLHR